jgi:uncharacterized membrane protein
MASLAETRIQIPLRWVWDSGIQVYGVGNSGMPERPGHPTWWWGAIGGGIALIAIVAIVFVLFANGNLNYGGTGPRPVFGFWGGFFLLFLLLWVGFFVIRIALWSGRGRGGYYGPQGRHRDPAVMMARQRYARGEITREQYDQIMTDLGRRGRGPGGPLSGS